MRAGRSSRAMAIRQPGMFLSQPGRATRASYHCALMTVSIESAIRSREGSEKLMPSVPIEIPSETPTLLNRIPTQSAATTPSFTAPARSSRCMLQGLPSYQIEPMHVAGIALVPDRADAHLRLVEVGLAETRRVEHRLRGSLTGRLCDPSRVTIQGVGHDALSRSMTDSG